MASNSAHAYLLLSTSLCVVWLILYGSRSALRRQMLWISLGTMPLGLTEPLFVPAYWNPPTLLDLARRTGFDLESLLFSFAIGGIVFAAYDALAGTAPAEDMRPERNAPRHRYHLAAVLAAPAVFLAVLAITTLNPIYAAALILVAGFVGGLLFLALYFGVFAAFNVAFPGYVVEVWNLRVLTGIRVVGVPLEELLFAFTFGLYWSSVYEHFRWRRSRSAARMATEALHGGGNHGVPS